MVQENLVRAPPRMTALFLQCAGETLSAEDAGGQVALCLLGMSDRSDLLTLSTHFYPLPLSLPTAEAAKLKPQFPKHPEGSRCKLDSTSEIPQGIWRAEVRHQHSCGVSGFFATMFQSHVPYFITLRRQLIW